MKKTKDQSGFTIIEILIATLVFSIVLIVCLEGVTHIGKLYYKGVSSSQTQELIRNLSSDFTQQIQFGGKNPMTVVNGNPAAPLIFCIGDYRYRAIINREMGEPGVPTVLKRKPYTGTCDLTDTNFNDAVELASKGMRIQRIHVTNDVASPGLWTVDIKVALGGDDLLDFGGGPNDDPTKYEAVLCKTGLAGSEFCSTSDVSTTVARRIR